MHRPLARRKQKLPPLQARRLDDTPRLWRLPLLAAPEGARRAAVEGRLRAGYSRQQDAGSVRAARCRLEVGRSGWRSAWDWHDGLGLRGGRLVVSIVCLDLLPRRHRQRVSTPAHTTNLRTKRTLQHPHRQHCFHRRTSRRCRCRGWVRVLWHNGQTNNYRVGCQGCHDLQLCQILD
mmetsp:Transcript_16843/g.54412  ORF Transcript_16843/g.54412 Transcript_16843/m.54412 type:complete len:177 (-) Transcript_16843:29-559(-)